MRTATILRAAAIVMALGAIADPSYTQQHEAPLPVLVRSASSDAPDRALAERVRDALEAALPDRIDVDSSGAPAAIVVAGGAAEITTLPDAIPISVVTDDASARRNVRIVHLHSSPVMLAGLTGSIAATIEATQAEGETSVMTLEQDAIELGRVEHTWRSPAETFEARFEHVPPTAGVRSLRVVARPLDRETTSADNHADIRLMVEDRKLKVLVYEPRPSWTATFIRRALESEPIFDVAALSRPSRGVEVRAGSAPERLRPDTIDPFDLIVVGAPEELRQDEIDALTRFARVRGGTFVLAPDRRPSGAYVKSIPVGSFEERLLETATPVSGPGGTLRGMELAVAVRPAPSVEPVAALTAGGRSEPVVFSWPISAGTGVFAGALDAWRHRAREEFPAFWRAFAAAAAAESPRRIEAVLDPGIASPDRLVTLEVRIRATEADSQHRSIEFPSVAARLIRPDGSIDPIRLWPAAEAGVFEGRFEAPGEGSYVVQASAGDATFDTALVVADDVRNAQMDGRESLALLTAATGGVIAPAADLSSLVTHLEGLPLPTAARSIHPARSPWWMAGFVLLLCAEWTMRRRRGLS